MSNIDSLRGRNQAFASTDARRKAPALPFLPHLGLYIVTCIDCRTDPADILGITLGEAVVERNVGGRVTPAVLRDDDALRHSFAQRIGVDERSLADTPVLDPQRTVRTDVERVLWAQAIPDQVTVSGHVYEVNTGLLTTVVEAKARK